MSRQAVVVSGIGAVTAAGIGAMALWGAVRGGTSCIHSLDSPGFEKSRVRKAASVLNFDIAAYFDPPKVATLDRFAALALVAADEALEQSGLSDERLGERCAVILGSGIGGASTSEAAALGFHIGGQRPDPMAIPKIMPSASASQISMKYGAIGPVFCISSACASSSQAIGLGLQMIRAGIVDRAIVGGSEAMLTPAVMRAWEMLRVLTPGLNRPFSRDRDGMVLGEGAGVLVLERADECLARGATPIAELCGYGTSGDAGDLLKPDPEGAARAMSAALADAGIGASNIGYVNAHGTGTILNDAAETLAIGRVFVGHDVPMSSTKPVHGHTIGAAGAVELIVTIQALIHQWLPPTINWTTPDPQCAANVVPNTGRDTAMQFAMSNSFAFGGINASLVVRRYS
jgi:nodulation protein E